MMLIQDNLDVYSCHNDQISIKDLSEDLNIGKKKWDFVFDFILGETNRFYFLGERLEYFDNDLVDLIESSSEKVFYKDEDWYKILFELSPANLLISRGGVSSIWSYYEYPAIFFLSTHSSESELINLIKKQITYSEIARSMNGVYVVHRNFEPNVLWVEKSSDMQQIVVA